MLDSCWRLCTRKTALLSADNRTGDLQQRPGWSNSVATCPVMHEAAPSPPLATLTKKTFDCLQKRMYTPPPVHASRLHKHVGESGKTPYALAAMAFFATVMSTLEYFIWCVWQGQTSWKLAADRIPVLLDGPKTRRRKTLSFCSAAKSMGGVMGGVYCAPFLLPNLGLVFVWLQRLQFMGTGCDVLDSGLTCDYDRVALISSGSL